MFKRGYVGIAELDPAVGGEIKKTRPVVIVSNDHINEFNRTVMVMPITSGHYSYYHWVNIQPPEGGLKTDSRIITDQIRTVDKSRFQKIIGKVGSTTLRAVEQAIRNNFALPEGDVLES